MEIQGWNTGVRVVHQVSLSAELCQWPHFIIFLKQSLTTSQDWPQTYNPPVLDTQMLGPIATPRFYLLPLFKMGPQIKQLFHLGLLSTGTTALGHCSGTTGLGHCIWVTEYLSLFKNQDGRDLKVLLNGKGFNIPLMTYLQNLSSLILRPFQSVADKLSEVSSSPTVSLKTMPHSGTRTDSRLGLNLSTTWCLWLQASKQP